MSRTIIEGVWGGIVDKTHILNDGRIVSEKTQYVAPVIELNKFDYNNYSRFQKPQDLRLKADIPVSVVEEWNKELRRKGAPRPNCLLPEHRFFLRAKINDPDNKAWLVCPGRM